jgi:hypothetical protein
MSRPPYRSLGNAEAKALLHYSNLLFSIFLIMTAYKPQMAEDEAATKLSYPVSRIYIMFLINNSYCFPSQFLVVFSVDQEMYAEVNADFVKHNFRSTRDLLFTKTDRKFAVSMGKGRDRIDMDCYLITFCRTPL